jgi:hypothetical protein
VFYFSYKNLNRHYRKVGKLPKLSILAAPGWANSSAFEEHAKYQKNIFDSFHFFVHFRYIQIYIYSYIYNSFMKKETKPKRIELDCYKRFLNELPKLNYILCIRLATKVPA